MFSTEWGLSSAGRASALQAGGHRFEPCRPHYILKMTAYDIAGWSSLVARRAHNPKVVGSNPSPAIMKPVLGRRAGFFIHKEINICYKIKSMLQSDSYDSSILFYCQDYSGLSYTACLGRARCSYGKIRRPL